MYMTLMSLYITHVMQVKVCVMNTLVIIIMLSSKVRVTIDIFIDLSLVCSCVWELAANFVTADRHAIML